MLVKVLIAILLVLGGSAVFLFGNPWGSAFPTNHNVLYAAILTVLFLAAALLFKRIEALQTYHQAAQALFIASAALLCLNTGVLNLHNASMPPLKNIALDKFSQFLHVVPLLVVLALLCGWDWQTFFFSKGNLKETLTFGLVSFAVWSAIALVMGIQNSGFFTTLWRSLPLVLLFIFSNAFMEELWFRGIFLKPYQALLGTWGAIIVTAIVFAAPHFFVAYDFPGGNYVFGMVVLGLGLVGGFVMLKHDSILGAILFHAGYDLMVLVPILNTV